MKWFWFDRLIDRWFWWGQRRKNAKLQTKAEAWRALLLPGIYNAAGHYEFSWLVADHDLITDGEDALILSSVWKDGRHITSRMELSGGRDEIIADWRRHLAIIFPVLPYEDEIVIAYDETMESEHS